MKKDILVLIYIIALIPANIFANEINMPSGWRVPTEEERVEIWGPSGKKVYQLVQDDFNNDGIVDEARLLRKVNGPEIAFFMFISNGSSHKENMIVKWENSIWLNRLGIAPVKPGTYKIWPEDLGQNEPREKLIMFPAVELFLSESASQYYYYDKDSKQIESIQISD